MTRQVYAPVALFVYRRPDHTMQVIDSLLRNPAARHTDLIVFSDAARSEQSVSAVDAVRDLVWRVKGFRSLAVIQRACNWGLSRSLTEGIGSVLQSSDKVVVLEDDLAVSEYFLDYMNDGLNLYRVDKSVASIHGYRYPTEVPLPETYFLRGADCWGWGTWDRAWRHYRSDGRQLLEAIRERGLQRQFDFDGAFPFTRMLQSQAAGRLDSWAIRWYASAFLDDMYTLYPGESLVANIGHDGSGEHSGVGTAFDVRLAQRRVPVLLQPVEQSHTAQQAFGQFLAGQTASLSTRLRLRLRRMLQKP